jgi:5,10-methylenetetrahydromethanopterin reductase
MKFTLHCSPYDFEEVVSRGIYADQHGFDQYWIAENQFIHLDPYVCLALVASKTSRTKLATGVTNPVFRHPSAIAGGMACIDLLSGGRALLCLGSGDTPVYMAGLKAASVQEMEDAVRLIKRLTAGLPTKVEKREVVMKISKRALPVYLAAEGPKTLRAAGRVADGVLMGSGFDKGVIKWALDNIKEGSKEAGRSISEIEVMGAGLVNIAKDRKEARDGVRGRLANRAHHNFRFTYETVPPEHLEEVKNWMKLFDLDNALNEGRQRELLPEYLVDRFSITGTVQEVINEVEGIRKLGIDHIMIDPPFTGYEKVMHTFAEEVVPRFN